MKVTDHSDLRGEREREAARRERQALREHRQLVGPPPPQTIVAPPRVVRPAPARSPRRGMFVIPFLVLISLAAGAVATVALLKTRPTSHLTARLDALGGELRSADAQIAGLRAEVAAGASARTIERLTHSVAGLRKTVGGVQNTLVPMRAQLAALHVCLPQLQAEMTGVTVRPGRHGTVTRVGLSAACAQILSSAPVG